VITPSSSIKQIIPPVRSVTQTFHERLLHPPGLVFDEKSVDAAKKWLETTRFEDAGSSYINTRSAVVIADLMQAHRAEGPTYSHLSHSSHSQREKDKLKVWLNHPQMVNNLLW
jgi:hypothetical protein